MRYPVTANNMTNYQQTENIRKLTGSVLKPQVPQYKFKVYHAAFNFQESVKTATNEALELF
jgi:hypothetical protein